MRCKERTDQVDLHKTQFGMCSSPAAPVQHPGGVAANNAKGDGKEAECKAANRVAEETAAVDEATQDQAAAERR